MQTDLDFLRAENAALQNLLRRKDLRIERLEEEIRLHLLARFGRKSEVFENPLQPSLFNELEILNSESSASAPDDEIVVGPYNKKHGHRKALPEFLPRERVEHDLSEDAKTCKIHNEALIKIGEDVTEQLEIVPEQIKVLQHVRPKYKCPCCEGGIVQALIPKQPIPGSMASPSLLSYICVAKYVDHMPLFRLENKFERIFVDLPRQTMARWMIKLCDLFTPIYNLMQDDLVEGGVIQMDETTVQVLKEPDRSASAKSYMWVRARDATTGPPIVLYDYFPSRSATVVSKLLGTYSGVLQTDGFPGYDSFSAGREILHAGCWAHCRRKFWEAFKASRQSKNSLAEQGLEWIKAIYKIESETKDLSSEGRLNFRQAKMEPIISSMKDWLEKNIGQAPATLKTGEAMQYALQQWPKLICILQDGRIPLDTNFIESRIRPFTIGRKNWVFSDTPAGAHASAMIYSIVETAKANRMEPYAYLRELIARLPTASTISELTELLPYNISKPSLH